MGNVPDLEKRQPAVDEVITLPDLEICSEAYGLMESKHDRMFSMETSEKIGIDRVQTR